MASVGGSLRRRSLRAAAVGEDGGMGGGFGVQRRLLEDVVVGEEGPMKGCSTERKVEAPAAVCLKDEKPADAVVAAGGDGEVAPAGGKRLTELPKDEVLWILAQKPHSIEPDDDEERLLEFYPQEMIDRIRQPMRRAAKASATLEQEFFAFQDRVRKEFEEHGVVKVDDEFLADREQVRQWMCEAFDEVFDRMDKDFSDSDYGSYSDMYATDDEDVEEEVALESTSN